TPPIINAGHVMALLIDWGFRVSRGLREWDAGDWVWAILEIIDNMGINLENEGGFGFKETLVLIRNSKPRNSEPVSPVRGQLQTWVSQPMPPRIARIMKHL